MFTFKEPLYVSQEDLTLAMLESPEDTESLRFEEYTAKSRYQDLLAKLDIKDDKK
jgi:uncharacterized protein (DUF952 family)